VEQVTENLLSGNQPLSRDRYHATHPYISVGEWFLTASDNTLPPKMSSPRMQSRKTYRVGVICNFPHCGKWCKTEAGLIRHHAAVHVIPEALQFPTTPPAPSASPPNSPDPGSPPRIPSPTYSSRRSPRRTPTGSPRQYSQGDRAWLKRAGVSIERHPILDGACSVFLNINLSKLRHAI